MKIAIEEAIYGTTHTVDHILEICESEQLTRGKSIRVKGFNNYICRKKMKRQVNSTITAKLLDSELWSQKIKDDCKEQKVFLAIRENQIDFYHKGGRLFNFSNEGFKTHIKYAAVIESNGKNYLTEKELKDYKLFSDFKSNYARIKENCSNYSGEEATGISEIYHRHSYLSKSNVVVLDIEVTFQSIDGPTKHDRIDILLYNKSTRSLQFVEAKHYTNKELWSTTVPSVIGQIQRYERQIKEKEEEILRECVENVRVLNEIFEEDIPEPVNIEDKVALLIFGFDSDQRDGRLKSQIIDAGAYEGIKIYSIGNINKLNPRNI